MNSEQINKLVRELESYIRVVEQSDPQDQAFALGGELMQSLQSLSMAQPPQQQRAISPGIYCVCVVHFILTCISA